MQTKKLKLANFTFQEDFIILIKFQPISCLVSLRQRFSNGGPRPAALISPWNLLEMRILSLPPNPLDQKLLGIGPRNLCFKKFYRWFWCTLKFENHCLKACVCHTCTSSSNSTNNPASHNQRHWKWHFACRVSFSQCLLGISLRFLIIFTSPHR